MTGKDLIIYILENDLEDEEIFKDGIPIWLISMADAAEKFGVGPETVRTWCVMGLMEYELIDGKIYIRNDIDEPKNKTKG